MRVHVALSPSEFTDAPVSGRTVRLKQVWGREEKQRSVICACSKPPCRQCSGQRSAAGLSECGGCGQKVIGLGPS